jgi:hypothetical protein
MPGQKCFFCAFYMLSFLLACSRHISGCNILLAHLLQLGSAYLSVLASFHFALLSLERVSVLADRFAYFGVAESL